MKNICWQGKAFKQLSFGKTKSAGRNSAGCITIFHRGGGSKRLQRRIDFQRNIPSTGVVERIEYDPNRSSRIALIRWSNLAAPLPCLPKVNSPFFVGGHFGPSGTEGKDCCATRGCDSNTHGNCAEGQSFATLSPSLSGISFFSYIIACDQLKSGDEIMNLHLDSETKLHKPNSSKIACRFNRPEDASRLSLRAHAITYSRRAAGPPIGAGCSLKGCSRLTNPRKRTFLPEMCWKKAELFYEKSGTLLRNLQPSGLRQPKVALVGSNMCSTDQLSDPLIQREKLRDNINLQVATATQQRFYQKIGTNCTLEKVSLGTSLHNIETYPGQGGILVRAAGTFAQLVQKFEKTRQCIVRLPSGRQLLLDLLCRATIGIVSNTSHSTRKLTKAGQSRWLGRMPVVRGVAMNPIDHPHGGRTKGGRPSVSPWGKPTKGSKTSKQPKARKHS